MYAEKPKSLMPYFKWQRDPLKDARSLAKRLAKAESKR